MPIYEYECKECGHQLDALQKLSDAPLTDCPKCGASALTKLVSAPSFRLKGGGWYETDFKKDGKRNLADDGKPPATDKAEGGKSDKKQGAESADKPAAKTSKPDKPAKPDSSAKQA